MVHSVMQDIHFPHYVLSKCRDGFTVRARKKSAILPCTGFSPLSTISYTELHPNWTIYLETTD